MSLYLSSYIASSYIKNCLEKSTENYQDTLEKLSSGSKFTSINQDVAKSSAAIKLEINMDSNSQTQENIKTGGELLATAEGYQENLLERLVRIRDLTVQIANETYSSENKDAILKEIRENLEYINNFSDTANFNGNNLLDGSSTSLTLLIGTSASDTLNIGSVLIDTHTDASALDIDIDPLITGETWTQADIQAYLEKVDNAAKTITSNIAEIGAYQNRLDRASGTLGKMNIEMSEYKSNLSDTDMAEASSDLIKYQIIQEASATMFTELIQIEKYVYYLLE